MQHADAALGRGGRARGLCRNVAKLSSLSKLAKLAGLAELMAMLMLVVPRGGLDWIVRKCGFLGFGSEGRYGF